MSASTCTAISLKVITYRAEQSNLLSSIASISSCIVAAMLAWFVGVTANDVTAILLDPRLYPTLAVELAAFYFARKNYAVNGEDMTSIKCALLLSLLFVPVISFVLTPLLGFEQSINLTYNSPVEMLGVLGVVSIFLLAYFYDKRVGKVKSWLYLILTPISLSFSMFFSVKMFQTHNGYSVMALVSLFNCLVFGLMAIPYLRAKKTLSPRSALASVGCGVLIVPFNVIAVSTIAVEFVTLLKRLSQVIVGIVFDVVYHRKVTISGKDAALVVILFGLAWWYYHR